MAIDAEIVRIGASRLSSTGLPVVEASNPIGSGDGDSEHFGEIDYFCPLGLSALPAAATRGADGSVTAHAEALVCRGVPGTTGVAINMRDERAGDAFGMLHPGDTCIHATGPLHGAMVLAREDGRATLLTSEDGTITGRTVFCEVAPGTTEEPGGNFRVVGPFGKMTMGSNGFHVRHYTGARLDLGGIGGSALPGPLSSLGAYVTVSAPIMRFECSALAIGTGTGSDAVAKSTAVVAALTATSAALVAIAAGVQALPTTGGGAAAAATIAGALNSAAGSIDAALALIPSTSTAVT
jgi:hypothetical protein